MATEDHDFEEINFFNFNQKKIAWNTSSKSAVGRLSTKGLSQIYELFSMELGKSQNAEYLANLFKESYLQHDNLAEATRYLANELFNQYGLVIIDGDNKRLKEQFIPHIENELIDQTCFNSVSSTIKGFGKNYKNTSKPEGDQFILLDG